MVKFSVASFELACDILIGVGQVSLNYVFKDSPHFEKSDVDW